MIRFLRKTIAKITLAALALSGLAFLAYRVDDHYFEIAKNLDIFAAVYRSLDTYYVDSIEPGKLMGTGIDAMVGSLDPYTTFYPENDLSELEFQTTGKYGGIGLSIRQIHDSTIVSDIYSGSPVDQAGIRAGDIIISINGQQATSLNDGQISKMLKGAPGTSLRLVLQNPWTGIRTEKTIIRREIDIRSVAYAGMVNTQVGYIKMMQFTQFSANEVSDALDSLKSKNPAMTGVIIDLRGNPGGLLDEAVKMSSLFVGHDQTVVSTRGKIASWNRDYRTGEIAKDAGIRLAVLTNRMSASASEIFAGAMQDLDRGVIIGQRSFGKGLVQTTRDLPYNSKLKLTVAKYYTPSGRCIQAIDYSHAATDGGLYYIPDSLRKTFRTRDGRIVRDGGGIEPDVHLPPDYLSDISMALLEKNYIFEFATQYYYTHPLAPESAMDFKITNEDYQRFLTFISGKDFDYQTRSEDVLEDFEKTAKKDGYFNDVSTQFDALKKQLDLEKQKDILKNSQEIKNLLEEEIIGRYYLEQGRIARSLGFDPEVTEAAAVLQDSTHYNDLLGRKDSLSLQHQSAFAEVH